jgi:hypothetical protein
LALPTPSLGHCGELALGLAVHGALEAHKQLLVEHCGDALERRQLRESRKTSSPASAARQTARATV